MNIKNTKKNKILKYIKNEKCCLSKNTNKNSSVVEEGSVDACLGKNIGHRVCFLSPERRPPFGS